jgi:hypothetical protein
MVEEVQERIDYLNAGPWIEEGQKAWERIGRPPKSAKERAIGSSAQKDLKKLLRPHWNSEIYLSEGLIRDSFDEALTVYQLYELAIENQYISISDIKDQVRRELTNLLWSQGARSYLQNYNYASVIYLAQRVGVDLGFKLVQLPQIRKGSEGRFASFLSQHRLWYVDPLLDGWIGFLDDYQEYGDEEEADKEVFWQFLKTKQRKFADERMLWAFVAGAERFVTRLADLVRALSVEEEPSYGLFYAYWLAKFYGFDLTGRGYVPDSKGEDWAGALLQSKRIASLIEERRRKGEEAEKLLEDFRKRDVFVRGFWKRTIAHLNKTPIVSVT